MTLSSELIHNLGIAQISSCSCQTKTPDAAWHDTHCLYRVLSETIAALTHLQTDNNSLRLQHVGMQAVIEELQAELAICRESHSNMVSRNALLRQRHDMPVDRIPAHDKLVELQATVARQAAQIERLGGKSK